MLEIRVTTNRGWMALDCSCPAGRAVFTTEAAAQAALESHFRTCGNATPRAAFRACAVEPGAA